MEPTKIDTQYLRMTLVSNGMSILILAGVMLLVTEPSFTLETWKVQLGIGVVIAHLVLDTYTFAWADFKQSNEES